MSVKDRNRGNGLILCPADNTGIDDLNPVFTRNLATVLIARGANQEK